MWGGGLAQLFARGSEMHGGLVPPGVASSSERRSCLVLLTWPSVFPRFHGEEFLDQEPVFGKDDDDEILRYTFLQICVNYAAMIQSDE